MINSSELQDAFTQYLGRPPKPDELAFFTQQAQDNNLSGYEIGEILKGSPEAQRSQATQDVRGYSDMLGRYDQQTLDKGINTLEAKFRGQGRSASGSAYAAAFAQTAQNLAMARQSQLADLYRSRLDAASGAESGRSQDLRQRGYDLADQRRERAYQLEDFYMGRDNYNSQLNAINRQRRNQAYGQLGGAALGAGIGAAFPAIGPAAGAIFGSRAGGLFG